MSESDGDARHVSLANIDTLWSGGSPVALPIAGSPACTLDLDPGHGTVALVTPFMPPEPDLARWRNIRFRRVAADVGTAAELTVTVDDNLHAVYGLLASVADHLQLDQQPLPAAVALAITQHRNMLAGRAGLSSEREVGLYGELLVLKHIIDSHGPAAAVGSWHGPLLEEHDFVFADIHLEVKTTTAEQRRHVIHGFSQLVPLGDVPLSLVSVQLTRGASDVGRTLTQLVADVRNVSAGYRPRIDDCLDASGWLDGDAGLYSTSWTKRNQNRAYNVDDQFPALTLARLANVVPRVEFVFDPVYRVDVSHFAHSPLPGLLAGLVESPGDFS